MSRDSNDSDAVELAKLAVLELFGDSPRDKITRGPHAPLQFSINCLLAYLSLKAHLNGTEDIRELPQGSGLLQRPHKHEDLMCRSIRKQLKVVWSVLIVTGHEDSHQFVQKVFT